MPRDDVQLEWHPLHYRDLPELDVLLTAIEEADDPAERHSCHDLYAAFEAGPSSPYDTSVARDSSGRLVAFGWNHLQPGDGPVRVHLQGGVHPGWRRRGVGRRLLGRQVQHAQAWHAGSPGSGPLALFGYAEEQQLGQRRLFEELGLEPVRWYADMTRPLQGELPSAAVPEGIQLVPLSRRRSEAVRRAHNESFADHWGVQPVSASDWDRQLSRSQSRLGWSWVAQVAETAEVVGYATNAAYVEDWDAQGCTEGWTDRLGVRKAWRGQGVAQALLAASMRSFAEAGLERAGLGVDAEGPTPAFELYEQLGYSSSHTVVMYLRTEDPDVPSSASGPPSG